MHLKIFVRPSRYFEFDMPALSEQLYAYTQKGSELYEGGGLQSTMVGIPATFFRWN